MVLHRDRSRSRHVALRPVVVDGVGIAFGWVAEAAASRQFQHQRSACRHRLLALGVKRRVVVEVHAARCPVRAAAAPPSRVGDPVEHA